MTKPEKYLKIAEKMFKPKNHRIYTKSGIKIETVYKWDDEQALKTLKLNEINDYRKYWYYRDMLFLVGDFVTKSIKDFMVDRLATMLYYNYDHKCRIVKLLQRQLSDEEKTQFVLKFPNNKEHTIANSYCDNSYYYYYPTWEYFDSVESLDYYTKLICELYNNEIDKRYNIINR